MILSVFYGTESFFVVARCGAIDYIIVMCVIVGRLVSGRSGRLCFNREVFMQADSYREIYVNETGKAGWDGSSGDDVPRWEYVEWLEERLSNLEFSIDNPSP